jgi:outer membrane biosynthesis protein TonB
MVDQTGAITQIKVLSGDAVLAGAAKSAVWHWRYEPGTLNGRPIPMKVQIRILFQGRQ